MSEPINLANQSDRYEFAICTLVTDFSEYARMVASFRASGFLDDRCEYLFFDNSLSNEVDAYQALNKFILMSRAKYIIICHQDVELIYDEISSLRERLVELDAIDHRWAIAGNAGSTPDGRLCIRITDPHGADQKVGKFPSKVSALDENFLLVKRNAHIACSADLHGYHHYGFDICMMADILGYSSYAINFHLRHKSGGRLDYSFFRSRDAIACKYDRALQPRWLSGVTGHPFHVGHKGALYYSSRIVKYIVGKLTRVPILRIITRRYRFFKKM